MAVKTAATFHCAGCGKTFAWKPELAGKRAKCSKCGTTLTVPSQIPQTEAGAQPTAKVVAGSVVGADREMYDLAEGSPLSKAPSASSAPVSQAQGPVRVSSTTPTDMYGVADDGPAGGKPVATKAPVVATPPSNQPVMRKAARRDEDGGDMYDVAEDLRVVKPVARAAPAPVLQGSSDGTGPPAGVLAYGGAPIALPSNQRREEFANSLGGEPWRELWLPAGMVLLGIALQVYLSIMETGLSVTDSLPTIAIRLFGGLILSFAAIAMVGRIFEISFGAPGPAILKVSAVVLLAPTIGEIVGHLVGHDSFFVRSAVASMLMLPLMFLLFWWLFQMEADDARWLMMAIWFIQTWVVNFILAAMLSGSGDGGIFGGPSNSADDQIAIMLDINQLQDAKPWLEKTTNRTMSDCTNAQALAMVNKLYELGAQEVNLIVDGPYITRFIVTLPRDKQAREKLFTWSNAATGDALKDEKRKYLEVYAPGAAMLDAALAGKSVPVPQTEPEE